MNNKKILVSFLLVVLIALSVSAVSAENTTDVLAVDDAVEEVAVDEGVDDVSANTVTTDAQNATGVQNAVDSAQAGDTVLLNGYYDFGDSCVNVIGKDNLIIDGQGTTIINGTGSGKGFFYVEKSASVTIKGIAFNDTNPKNNFTYGGEVAGWGVQFNGNDAAGGVVDGCTFNNFNQAVVIKTCDHITVKNSEFTGGYATVLVNMPLVNKEQGTKAVSVGGSFYTTVENCTFDGPMLDAISIAQASGDAKIIGNTFKNNVYSIFFGGASTDGTFITGNTFEKCGSFNGTYKGEELFWEGYPVISIQKASSGVYITDNLFKAINNNFLIASEQGNTAHGYPSTLGDINVTGNKVVKFSEDVVTSGVTLLHILCRNGALNPYAPITVTDNTFVAGVKPVVVWTNDWGSETDTPTNIIIPAAPAVQTLISIADVTDGVVTAVLKDINNKDLAGQNITYSVGEDNFTGETDENGKIVIANATGKEVTIKFEGSASKTVKLAPSEAKVAVPTPIPKDLISTTLTLNDVSVYALANGKVSAVLKDAEGNAVANKTIGVLIDGETAGIVETDENGTVTVPFKYAEFGVHSVVAYFAGDEKTKSSLDTSKINVKKLATTSTVVSSTYKVKKVKKFYVVLKTGKTAIKGKKITVTVNGKTYSAKTNAKGVATFNLKIAKKGTFKYAVKFAGDNTYKASSATGKIVVKK